MNNFVETLIRLAAVIVAITVHEFAHAVSAASCGDDTAKSQGRISLNPARHFDPVGFAMIVFTSFAGFGIGWGKPVMVNPMRFRNMRWDNVKVSAWGPISNIIQATVCAIILKVFGHILVMISPLLFEFFLWMVLVNIGLACFNLIPLPPLDGSHILAGFLPAPQARQYANFARQYGMAVLLVLIMTGGIQWLVAPPMRFLEGMLLRI